MTVVMKPYFATTLVLIVSSFAPVTTLAVAETGEVPSLVRPRPLQGCTVTVSVCARRFALPDPELVQNPILTSSKATTHTGVATGLPSRRNVVSRMYFSSARDTARAYRDSGKRPTERASRIPGVATD